MDSTLGLFESFKGIMLLLRIIIFFAIIFLFYPFIFYVLIAALEEATSSNIEQIVLPIIFNMILVSMSLSALYGAFYHFALRKRVIGQKENN
jgi:hypothetical protein